MSKSTIISEGVEPAPNLFNNVGEVLFEAGALDNAIDSMVNDLSDEVHPVIKAVAEDRAKVRLAQEKEKAIAAFTLMTQRMQREIQHLREMRQCERQQAGKVKSLDQAIKQFLKTADVTAYAELVYGKGNTDRFQAEIVNHQLKI